MNLIHHSFNLSPWREKKLIHKSIVKFFLHILLIVIFFLIFLFSNNFFNQIIFNQKNRLLYLNKELNNIEQYNKKIENKNLNIKKKLKFKKIFEKNKKSITITHDLVNKISKYIPPQTVISYFCINEKTVILHGVAEKESEIFLLTNQLKKINYIKNLSLEEINKKNNKFKVYFKIHMNLERLK